MNQNAPQVKKLPLSRDQAKAEFARLLRDFLAQQKRTAPWLAQQMGVHRSTTARLVRGDILPDPEHCQRLAEITGQSVQHLLRLAGHLPAGVQVETGDGSGGTTGPEMIIPDLGDPELGFYLSQIGTMPAETRQIIKGILREEYFTLQKERLGPNRGRVEGGPETDDNQNDPWPTRASLPVEAASAPSHSQAHDQSRRQGRPPYARPQAYLTNSSISTRDGEPGQHGEQTIQKGSNDSHPQAGGVKHD